MTASPVKRQTLRLSSVAGEMATHPVPNEKLLPARLAATSLYHRALARSTTARSAPSEAANFLIARAGDTSIVVITSTSPASIPPCPRVPRLSITKRTRGQRVHHGAQRPQRSGKLFDRQGQGGHFLPSIKALYCLVHYSKIFDSLPDIA